MKKLQHVKTGRVTKNDRVRTITFGKGIKARIAYPKYSRTRQKRAKPGKGKGRIVSLLFDPIHYSLTEAKRWAKSHGYRVLGSAKAGTTEARKKKRKIPARRRSIKRPGRSKRRTKPLYSIKNKNRQQIVNKAKRLKVKATGTKSAIANRIRSKLARMQAKRKNPSSTKRIEAIKKAAAARARRMAASKTRAKGMARRTGLRRPSMRRARRYRRSA